MKNIITFLLLAVLTPQNFINASPKISFTDLMILTEQNPHLVLSAREEAIRQSKPVTILSTDNVMYDVKFIENGKLVYSVFTDFADIYAGGYAVYFEEINLNFNSNKLRIDFGKGRIIDNTEGVFEPVVNRKDGLSNRYIMAVENTNDRALLFDDQTGNLVEADFIPTTQPQLNLPKHGIQNYKGDRIFISDQNSDAVQRFDTSGAYIDIFAPAGGVNTSILDNIRGVSYRPNSNLLVTVGGGTSTNTIQQFDFNGNPLGAFIGTNLNSPFAIFERAGDLLISNSSGTNRISRFTHSGNSLGSFYTGNAMAFPQQMIELTNGDIAVASFSPPSGIAILNKNGIYQTILTGVTGNRGVQLLGNGNYLTTNAGGIHEINPSTGSLIRTIVSGTSFQYISVYNTAVLNLSLTTNLEACTAPDTVDVELRSSVSPYNMIEHQQRKVTQNSPAQFYFTKADNGTAYYIIVKHRNSIETWSKLPQTFTGNSLSYDFTTSDTQAFGDNMVNVGGEWSFFTGDVNQDGAVDLSDGSLIDNDAYNFVSGYVNTDLNYDDAVDITDAAYADNNGFQFVSIERP